MTHSRYYRNRLRRLFTASSHAQNNAFREINRGSTLRDRSKQYRRGLESKKREISNAKITATRKKILLDNLTERHERSSKLNRSKKRVSKATNNLSRRIQEAKSKYNSATEEVKKLENEFKPEYVNNEPHVNHPPRRGIFNFLFRINTRKIAPMINNPLTRV